MGKTCSTLAALCVAAGTASPVRAEVVTDLAPFTWDSARPEVLMLDGEITRRTPPLLGLALGRFEVVEVLELSSPGGDAYAAMAMVPTIRAAGLATRIAAGDKCHSACAFLYFAGTDRAAEGELGVHQLASANEASGHFIMNDVLDVFSDLGLPDTVRRRMMQTPPNEMYVFSGAELAALGLVGPALPPAPADPAPVAAAPAGPATHLALDIAGEANGRVVIELLDDLAPEHAARLVTLAREGAYDGVVFHRVIDGFMAQTGDVAFGRAGGDLARAGTGGSSYPDLPAEFSDTPFVAGTVGMARAADPDSANSQFFIMFEPGPFLDGQYTVVGQVVEGMDVVRAIKRGEGGNGAVASEPDRIVAAVALSEDGTPLPAVSAVEAASPPAAPPATVPEEPAIPRAGIEAYFDFSDPATVTLNIGWTLPQDLASVVNCAPDALRTLDDGFSECVNTFSEPSAYLLGADPSEVLALAANDDGSRSFSMDVSEFLAPLSPTREEADQLKDTRFSLVVGAGRIVESSGVVGSDGQTARLDLTVEQVVDRPETIPTTFTARFF